MSNYGSPSNGVRIRRPFDTTYAPIIRGSEALTKLLALEGITPDMWITEQQMGLILGRYMWTPHKNAWECLKGHFEYKGLRIARIADACGMEITADMALIVSHKAIKDVRASVLELEMEMGCNGVQLVKYPAGDPKAVLVTVPPGTKRISFGALMWEPLYTSDQIEHVDITDVQHIIDRGPIAKLNGIPLRTNLHLLEPVEMVVVDYILDGWTPDILTYAEFVEKAKRPMVQTRMLEDMIVLFEGEMGVTDGELRAAVKQRVKMVEGLKRKRA